MCTAGEWLVVPGYECQTTVNACPTLHVEHGLHVHDSASFCAMSIALVANVNSSGRRRMREEGCVLR